MSIEKISKLSKTIVEQSPYAQIFNNIIEHIKDNDAFRIYAYLISKSSDWVVVKEWTAKQCGVSERKAKRCWSYLERCGLLEYLPVRNAQGKFVKHDMIILNGTRFNKDEPFLRPEKPTGCESELVEELSTKESHHRCNSAPSGKDTRVDFAPLPKKDITKKDLRALPNKNKSFCVEDQKAKEPTADAGAKPINRRNYGNEVKHSWAKNASSRKEVAESSETKSNVKWWEPGYPDYDRYHS